MDFANFGTRHFTAAEKTTLITALTALENAFEDKLVILTPEQRQQYGSVNEQNKLIINKVKDFYDSKPELGSPDVDWEEFQHDFETRAILESSINRLQRLVEGLGSAKILYDWDNYQAALLDYDFAKYKLNNRVEGFQTKVEEVAQFFTKGNVDPVKSKKDFDTTVAE